MRRAPKPEQCLHLAQRWYGVTEHSGYSRELRARSIEDLTLRCVTQPFAPEFVSCVTRLGSIRACHPERFGYILPAS
jgi:hypothetical protein